MLNKDHGDGHGRTGGGFFNHGIFLVGGKRWLTATYIYIYSLIFRIIYKSGIYYILPKRCVFCCLCAHPFTRSRTTGHCGSTGRWEVAVAATRPKAPRMALKHRSLSVEGWYLAVDQVIFRGKIRKKQIVS